MTLAVKHAKLHNKWSDFGGNMFNFILLYTLSLPFIIVAWLVLTFVVMLVMLFGLFITPVKWWDKLKDTLSHKKES